MISHNPVLAKKVVKYINPKPGQIIVDATIGLAGHSLALLKKEPKLKIIGIDQDKQALKIADKNLKKYRNIELYHINFKQLDVSIREKVDAVIFDLGVSSMQLDDQERGFSFKTTQKLDMRMNQKQKLTAYGVVNNYSVEELKEIIKYYGEERWAKKIANMIYKQRQDREIKTTTELEETVKSAIPKRYWPRNINPATRTFQAIRIEVNNELTGLKQGLKSAFKLSKKNGLIVCISFHSLEDRIVKKQFKLWQKDCICPPTSPICTCDKKKEVEIITKKPIRPTEQEIKENPRARSAKMRVCKKII